MHTGLTFKKAIAKTRKGNVFTTHTPVPAGNDEFPLWLIDKNLSNFWSELGLTRDQFVDLARHQQAWGETFSMAILALRLSDGRNAVSELHGRVSAQNMALPVARDRRRGGCAHHLHHQRRSHPHLDGPPAARPVR